MGKLSSNKKDAAEQLLGQHDAALTFLKSHGALLNAVSRGGLERVCVCVGGGGGGFRVHLGASTKGPARRSAHLLSSE